MSSTAHCDSIPIKPSFYWESCSETRPASPGKTDPPLLPGEAAPITGNPLFLTRVQPTVTIGGQTARVLFSGMAPGWVGLWQMNVQIPAEIPPTVTPGSAVPLSITADGVTSNTVTIAVE